TIRPNGHIGDRDEPRVQSAKLSYRVQGHRAVGVQVENGERDGLGIAEPAHGIPSVAWCDRITPTYCGAQTVKLFRALEKRRDDSHWWDLWVSKLCQLGRLANTAGHPSEAAGGWRPAAGGRRLGDGR